MKIIFEERFLNRLENQVEYISHDSPGRANKFKKDILTKTKDIPQHPLRYRKSIHFNKNEIRDLIFK